MILDQAGIGSRSWLEIWKKKERSSQVWYEDVMLLRTGCDDWSDWREFGA